MERRLDSARNPRTESARPGAGKSGQTLFGCALRLPQAAFEIRDQPHMKFAGFPLRHRCQDLSDRCGGPEVVQLLISRILGQRQVEASKPLRADRAVAGPRPYTQGGELRITMRTTLQQGSAVD